MHAVTAEDHGFQFMSGQTKDYKFDICRFSAMHTAYRSNGKDWLAQSQGKATCISMDRLRCSTLNIQRRFFVIG